MTTGEINGLTVWLVFGIFQSWKKPKISSINRPAGNIEQVAIDKVANKDHKAMLVNKVIPAIKAKFPTSSKIKPIYI